MAPEEINEQRLQLQFAEIALANGDLDQAHDQFTELSITASPEIRYSAIWGLARTAQAQTKLHDALSHVDALLTASRSGEPGTPGLLVLLTARCKIYRQAGDFSRSIEVGEAAVQEVAELGLQGTQEEIGLASTLVASYWARGDLFAAQHLASQVIERAEKLGSRRAQGNAYWNACLVATARGQLPLALDLAAKTLALLSESALDRSLASMRITYAWLLLKLDPPQLDRADALLAQAHEVLASSSYGPDLANCEVEMARSALARGDLDTAASRAGDAIGRCPEGRSTVLQNAHVVRGLALILTGATEEGMATVSQAARRLDEQGAQVDAAQAWRELSEALIQRGSPQQAIEALRHAADAAGARSCYVRSDLMVHARD